MWLTIVIGQLRHFNSMSDIRMQQQKFESLSYAGRNKRLQVSSVSSGYTPILTDIENVGANI